MEQRNEILNEIVDIFDYKKDAHLPRVSHTPNPAKILHVPARVNHDPFMTTRKIHRRPRVKNSPNTQQITHVSARGELKCEQKPAEIQIPKPLIIFQMAHLSTDYLIKSTGEQQLFNLIQSETTAQYATTTTKRKNLRMRR